MTTLGFGGALVLDVGQVGPLGDRTMILGMNEGDLCVARVPVFQGLGRPEQMHIAEFARPVKVARGDRVFTPGATLSQVMVVHSGALKVSRVAFNGQEQVLRVARAGDVVGEREFLTGRGTTDVVTAVEDTQICVFDHEDLAEIFRTYPDIGERMLRSLSDRLASVERLLAAITSSDVAARVAAYILGLPQAPSKRAGAGQTGNPQPGGGRPWVKLPMAKREVASYLGTTPESLSRRLADFVAGGLILMEGGDIRVLNAPALEEVALGQK